MAGDAHLARRRPLLGMEQLEQRGLARAGMTGEEDEFASRDVERHVPEGDGAVGIRFIDVGKSDHARKIRSPAA